ncbi:MAG TPA: glutathione S-transferase family protein [Polyangiaceae bacterium]|jgi:glutathione S-transferase
MLKLHYHPLSSYSQKVVMALAEKDYPYEPALLDITSPEARAEYKKLYPLGKVPLLEGDGEFIPESSIIIEYVDTVHEGKTRLIPADPVQARKARFFDRISDLYVMEPMLTTFFDGRKPEAEREPKRVQAARERLDVSFAMFDGHFAKKTWVLGDTFSMADCALAPALGYLRMVHPFDAHANLKSYFGRVSERPSFQKIMAELAPYLARAKAGS